ncbi:MAG: TolC family protein [Bacteroidota bacterium]
MKKIVILLFSFLLITTAFGQTDLSLEEAIQIALQRNSALVKAKHNLEGNAASVKSAYGNLIPTLGINGSWDWSRLQNPNGATDSKFYNLSAGGSVVLFNGLANYANISGAKRDEEAAEFNFDKLKRNIVQTTTIFYYSILMNKALLKVREENLVYNQKLLETITERNRLGSAPIADLYAQQVQTGSAEVEVIRAQNQVDDAQNTLIDYLSLDVLEDYNFVSRIDSVDASNIDEYSKDFDNVKSMVDYALENRTDYMGQQRTVESADKGITVARGGLWPSITGNYGISKRDDTINGVIDFDYSSWGVGIGLNFPIFSNWNTEASVEYAKIRLLNAEEDLRALERQIKIEVKQGFLDFEAVKKALDVAIKTVQSASENRRVQYERYSLGSGTFLEVLQSDRDYQNALSLRIDAEFNFHSAREALLNSIGKLGYQQYETNSDEGE